MVNFEKNVIKKLRNISFSRQNYLKWNCSASIVESVCKYTKQTISSFASWLKINLVYQKVAKFTQLEYRNLEVQITVLSVNNKMPANLIINVVSA